MIAELAEKLKEDQVVVMPNGELVTLRQDGIDIDGDIRTQEEGFIYHDDIVMLATDEDLVNYKEPSKDRGCGC